MTGRSASCRHDERIAHPARRLRRENTRRDSASSAAAQRRMTQVLRFCFFCTVTPPLHFVGDLLTEEAGRLDDEYDYEQGEGKGV